MSEPSGNFQLQCVPSHLSVTRRQERTRMHGGGTVDKVTISHRGARYEIGLAKRYYAVWTVDAPRAEPIDRWPETPEGWSQAWARFTAIETPGTIAAVPRQRALTIPGFRRNATGTTSVD